MLQSSVLDLQRLQMEGGIYHSGTLFRSPSIKRADGNAVFSAYMLDSPLGAPLLQDLSFLLFRESRNHPSTVSGKINCLMWRYRRKLIGEGKSGPSIFFNSPLRSRQTQCYFRGTRIHGSEGDTHRILVPFALRNDTDDTRTFVPIKVPIRVQRCGA